MKKNIIAGNWKMNKILDEGKDFALDIIETYDKAPSDDKEVVIIPPFIHLSAFQALLKNSVVRLGAQNCHSENSGAYTGEISVSMLRSCGVDYVVVGHSERRQYFRETEKALSKKTSQVLAHAMTPIFCCGESLEVREKGIQKEVISTQIKNSLFHLSSDQIQNVVIAYEPVWAIGTGNTATPQQVQDMHYFIRSLLKKQYNEALAMSISILYGGSVKPENAQEIFANEDVDGGLIGGASLKTNDFMKIIRS